MGLVWMEDFDLYIPSVQDKTEEFTYHIYDLSLFNLCTWKSFAILQKDT